MDMSWQQHCSRNAARKYVCIINTYLRCHVMVQHIAPFSMLPHQAAYLARSPILQRHWCKGRDVALLRLCHDCCCLVQLSLCECARCQLRLHLQAQHK